MGIADFVFGGFGAQYSKRAVPLGFVLFIQIDLGGICGAPTLQGLAIIYV